MMKTKFLPLPIWEKETTEEKNRKNMGGAEKKVLLEIEATNVIARWPPEQQPPATATACVNKFYGANLLKYQISVAVTRMVII